MHLLLVVLVPLSPVRCRVLLAVAAVSAEEVQDTPGPSLASLTPWGERVSRLGF